jgi:predicted Zn-dependent peptidase
MPRKIWMMLALVGLTAAALPAGQGRAEPLDVPVKTYTLDNGLRLVVSENHTLPVVGVNVYYDVGSRDEVEGKTGFAHLFEHMMFEGSANVGKTMHMKYVMDNGGEMNGNTTDDRTDYFETMPSSELDMALWLEADRMRALDVNEDNFENQRQTVKEERRQRVDNQPYAAAEIRVDDLAYANFAYQHPTIGSMADLDAAPLSYVQWFYQTYYSPNDAVLTVVGDVDADDVKKQVEYYFGTIQQRERPASPDFTEPEQTALKQDTIQDPLANVPMSFMAFHVPGWRQQALGGKQADSYALDLLATILADGESSRLYKLLIDDKKIATGVDAGSDHHRGPDLFGIDTTLALGHTPDEARPLILGVIADIQKNGVTDEELQKAKNRTRAAFINGLQSATGLAARLGQYELYFGDATLLAGEPDRYDQVTAKDVQRVAKEYLIDTNRTDVDDLPAAPASASAEGGK